MGQRSRTSFAGTLQTIIYDILGLSLVINLFNCLGTRTRCEKARERLRCLSVNSYFCCKVSVATDNLTVILPLFYAPDIIT